VRQDLPHAAGEQDQKLAGWEQLGQVPNVWQMAEDVMQQIVSHYMAISTLVTKVSTRTQPK
jgi:hypothetical protein